jgi:hypothetical protein
VTGSTARARSFDQLAGMLVNWASRLAQFDAQLTVVAHDQDVRSTAAPRFQAGGDGLDQIHDGFAHQHPIAFTQVSHVDRPPFVQRPPDQLLNFGFVGHGGSPLVMALILCSHRPITIESSSVSPLPSVDWGFVGAIAPYLCPCRRDARPHGELLEHGIDKPADVKLTPAGLTRARERRSLA